MILALLKIREKRKENEKMSEKRVRDVQNQELSKSPQSTRNAPENRTKAAP